MFLHQDYPGPLELIVADGPCFAAHHCARNRPGVSAALLAANHSGHPDALGRGLPRSVETVPRIYS
jgi:hypothetical protein